MIVEPSDFRGAQRTGALQKSAESAEITIRAEWSQTAMEFNNRDALRVVRDWIDLQRSRYAWWSVLSLVLLSAAVSKAYQIANDPGYLMQANHLIVFSVGIVWLETLVGCWMLAGVYRSLTRWLVVCTFGAFSIAASVLAIKGKQSCGCFGGLSLDPWKVLAVDIVIVGCVLFFPACSRCSRASQAQLHRLFVAIIAAIILGGTLTTIIILKKRNALFTDGIVGATVGDEITVLRPETWTGKVFPLIDHIEFDLQQAELLRDRWVLILHHHDCSRCEEVLPKIEEWVLSDADARVAIIELPPYGSRSDSRAENEVRLAGRFAVGRLRADRLWFARTPLMVAIQDGLVVPLEGIPAELSQESSR